jgi:hypothetical protein
MIVSAAEGQENARWRRGRESLEAWQNAFRRLLLAFGIPAAHHCGLILRRDQFVEFLDSIRKRAGRQDRLLA